MSRPGSKPPLWRWRQLPLLVLRTVSPLPAQLPPGLHFFEQMARSSDIRVANLLQVEIFERLVREPNRLATAWKFMGPETKKIARDTARIWRCEENLPEE